MKRKCGYSIGVTMLVVGLTMVILGALIVDIVDNLIKDGIKDALRLPKDYDGWSEEKKENWHHYDTTFHYYFYNLTNSKKLLQGQEKPAFQQLGPYTLREDTTRFNVTWTSDGRFIKFREWWTKHWQDGNERLADKSRYTLTFTNPAYLAVMGQIAMQGQIPRESTSLAVFLGSNAQRTVAKLFLEEAGDFLGFVRVFGVSEYVGFILQGVAGPTYGSATNAVLQLAQLQAGSPPPLATTLQNAGSYSTGNFSVGFEFPAGALTLANVTVFTNSSDPRSILYSNVFNSDGSINTLAGIVPWAMAAQQSPPHIAYLKSAWGPAYAAVHAYIMGKAMGAAVHSSYVPASEAYRSTLMYRISTGSHPCPVSTTSPWQDLGVCQWAYGNVTKHFTSGAMTRVPFSCMVVQNTKSVLNCTGFELANALNKDYQPVTGRSSMPFAQAKTTLQTMNATDWSTGIIKFKSMITFLGQASFIQSGALTSTELNDTFFDNYGGIKGVYAQPTTQAQIDKFTQAVTFCLYNIVHLPNLLINRAVADNGGLFTKRTPHEMLFGFGPANSPTNDPLLRDAGATFPGFASNYSSANDRAARNTDPPHELYTGMGKDIYKVRRYGKWYGITEFKSLHDAYREKSCISIPGTGGYYCLMNPVWTSDEDITRTDPAGNHKPLVEDSLPDKITVFTPVALRGVDLLFDREVDIKGIKCNRYTVDRRLFWNSTEHAFNAKYRMNGHPRGLVPMWWWNAGLDVYLGQPNFFQGDPGLKEHVSGMNPTPPAATIAERPNDVYGSYLDVEPLTGATFNAHRRLLMTLKVSSVAFDHHAHRGVFGQAMYSQPNVEQYVNNPLNLPGFPQLMEPTKLPDERHEKVYYMPVFWADETGTIEDDDAKDFRDLVYGNRDLAERIETSFLVVGVFLLVVSLVLIMYFKRKQNNTVQRLESKQDDVELNVRPVVPGQP